MNSQNNQTGKKPRTTSRPDFTNKHGAAQTVRLFDPLIIHPSLLREDDPRRAESFDDD